MMEKAEEQVNNAKVGHQLLLGSIRISPIMELTLQSAKGWPNVAPTQEPIPGFDHLSVN